MMDMGNKEGLSVTCYHPDCGHSWRYAGNSTIYMTCPGCQRRIKIKEAFIKANPGKRFLSRSQNYKREVKD